MVVDKEAEKRTVEEKMLGIDIFTNMFWNLGILKCYNLRFLVESI